MNPPAPRWSVMVPAYNCARFLPETLSSVLAQDPGPAQMQIEVVDDCSTRDDPASVVEAVGKGRIGFFRQPRNRGVTGNFNTCVERARGELVHILHGDDYVLPSFYTDVATAAAQHPECAIFFVRALVVDERGNLQSLSGRLPWLELPSHDSSPLACRNDIRTPGVVVRRKFYEEHGAFRSELVHVADWEMWIRAIRLGGGLSLNHIGCAYRSFAGNDTGRLAVSAENLRDYLRLGDILTAEMPGFDRGEFRAMVRDYAENQMRMFQRLDQPAAAAASEAVWHELAPVLPWSRRLRHAVRAFRDTLRRMR